MKDSKQSFILSLFIGFTFDFTHLFKQERWMYLIVPVQTQACIKGFSAEHSFNQQNLHCGSDAESSFSWVHSFSVTTDRTSSTSSFAIMSFGSLFGDSWSLEVFYSKLNSTKFYYIVLFKFII